MEVQSRCWQFKSARREAITIILAENWRNFMMLTSQLFVAIAGPYMYPNETKEELATKPM
jgi:hypothetical protein